MYKKQSQLENPNSVAVKENFREKHDFVVSVDSYASMINLVKKNDI